MLYWCNSKFSLSSSSFTDSQYSKNKFSNSEEHQLQAQMALIKVIYDYLSKLFRVLIWGWNIMLSLPKCSTLRLISLYTTVDSLQGSMRNSTLLGSDRRPVYIPPEILVIILSRLPVKSLVRFKAVSRIWRFKIQSHFFVSLQLKKTIHRPPRFVLLKTSLNKLILIDSEGCRTGEVPVTEDWCHTIMGSYNGLLCVFGSDALSPFLVWNPMTGQRICLPMSSDSDLPVLHHYADIGFDSSTKKYKVVRVYTDFLETNNTKFEIITLGETSWRPLYPPFDILEMGKGASMYFNGFVYWVIATNFCTTWNNVRILSLDLADERFQLIFLPQDETFPLFLSNYINWNLINLGAFLYLTALDMRWIGMNEEQHGYQLMHAWQLRNNDEGLDIRYLQTHKLYTNESLSYTSLLALGKDDSFLFKASMGYKSVPKLVQYFTKSEDHLVLGQLGDCHWHGIGSFEPSLVSPRVALLGLQ